jgi:hypothetical protein
MGMFGKTFQSRTDTLRFTEEGYLVWNPKKKISISQLKTDSFNYAAQRGEDMVLTTSAELDESIDTVAGFYTEIYFAFNCYKGNFYYQVIPLFDTYSSFVLGRYREAVRLEPVANLYFDLAEVYARRLKKEMRALGEPCLHRKNVELVFKKLMQEFYAEKLLLLKETWAGNKISAWEDKIEKNLKDLEAFR